MGVLCLKKVPKSIIMPKNTINDKEKTQFPEFCTVVRGGRELNPRPLA